MLKRYKALTFNIPCEGDIGGEQIEAGSRFRFLLRESQQNPSDSPMRKPPRQAHRSLCNASPCPQSTGGGGAGMGEAGGECQNRAEYKSVHRDKALLEGAQELLRISRHAVLVLKQT